ncbi:MAG: hypothetical protein BM556_00825 [Bacteriovorax sp. MedPE-SWde]|nr:MAG: hypothetical protein BM556_00825 [Bacteriovorax sp. MedPE-SWde]
MLLSKIIYYFVRLLNSTYRYRYAGVENLNNAKKLGPNGNYLLGVWHQNLLHGIMAQIGQRHVCIVSKSKDADPVNYTLECLGQKVVRGSSKNKAGVDKGGKAAKEEMITELSSGLPGAVTIDGPKGPAREVKPGIVDMARKSQTPLIPFIPVPESYWSFKSWDRFKLPKPFSRIVVYYGEPIIVTNKTEACFEDARVKLETGLIDLEPKAYAEFSNWKKLEKMYY